MYIEGNRKYGVSPLFRNKFDTFCLCVTDFTRTLRGTDVQKDTFT